MLFFFHKAVAVEPASVLKCPMAAQEETDGILGKSNIFFELNVVFFQSLHTE